VGGTYPVHVNNSNNFMRSLFPVFATLLLFAGCVAPAPTTSHASSADKTESQHRENALTDQAIPEQDRFDYVAAHAELKPPIRDAIINRRVIIGMTYEQALKSLGGGHDFHSSRPPVDGRMNLPIRI
jgi:hypothetical protein